MRGIAQSLGAIAQTPLALQPPTGPIPLFNCGFHALSAWSLACSSPKSKQFTNKREDDMKKQNSIARVGASAFLLTGFLAASSVMTAADAPDSEQVSKLLSEAKTAAFQIKEDAIIMESYTRVDVSLESHAVAINLVKDHVNELGRVVNKLNEAKGSASPWQRTAIDRIQPYLDELGGYTTAVIEHINGTPKHTAAEYKDYLEANVDYSGDLAAMIADYVNYGNAKQRVERLSAKLELAAAR
jgi:hypothetical protein